MELSLSSESADQSPAVSQAEPKPAKAPHPNQGSKSTPATKVRFGVLTTACGFGQNSVARQINAYIFGNSDDEGVCQRGAETRGGVLLLEDHLCKVQAGE